jgi:hypothetical protein
VGKARLQTLYDQETLARHYQTEADERIRNTDLPERLQEIDTLSQRSGKLEKKELQMEAEWIFKRIFPGGVLPDEDAAQPGELDVLQLELQEQKMDDRIAACKKSIEAILLKMREGEPVPKKAQEPPPPAEGEEAEEDASPRLRFELPFLRYYRKEDYARSELRPEQIAQFVELDLEYAARSRFTYNLGEDDL